MQRREFVMLASGYAAVSSLPAVAQQVAIPRIGVLLVGLSPESKAAQHFRRGLRDAGYIEGRNIVIEWRYAKGDYGRVSAFIDEFVRGNIDVMVMDSTVGTEAAKRATSTIPIVMVDPESGASRRERHRPLDDDERRPQL
jgi:putative ABC transport system substrate-binding protein